MLFFGITHAEIGLIFCKHWLLPKPITASVYCHHVLPDDDSQYADCKYDIAIVSLANYIASLHGIGSSINNHRPILQPEVLELLNIEKLNIKQLLNTVDTEMQDTCAFFDIKFPNLYKLRASLVESPILSSPNYERRNSLPGNLSINSLTIPHKSLNPDEIVPDTLAAIQHNFHFERLIMLNINPKLRNLETSYSWPESLKDSNLEHFNIKIDVLPSPLLNNLRERKASIINSRNKENKILLGPFKIEEFLLFPIVSNDRLVALLY
ncbi:hypothetical protein BMR02_02740 [Methylococcaceae bacterium HT1]|nr:hypothetical protein BMR02_02740 [Methylococcaceae bacterium HT1]TXL15270.1 hypothetical protein BMR05_04520 [Methylococcaceae bacterium HT4]TXL20463.1 hypothetical protein BMR06_04635 [Methylococcaceae bacterium HT5]TXL23795.1 hypothetical protein BMR03_00210 [Methylococcaceae bacterium HT2]